MTRGLVLLAALVAPLLTLPGCAMEPMAPGAASIGPPSPGDLLPPFGRITPRIRPPSSQRPAWLPELPPDMPRYRLPDDGHRDRLV
ncbi:hypothetical protein [Paracraurococcus ruber]|uniref:Argininosuccinate lyase n=1 Tax=Paracraurococcus ruber TaxID=77675 RepID=A0ABS1CVY9_9PROT|nr:hypothetical protein [Paracraurococcus ruber]MBK1658677.1 hypothetical protein [Paracraurococcus ruber]TDG31257.1 hypothetical protein E2C05_11590 [Paracraurococcus ruber]